MALTNAQRQKRFRERTLRDPDGALRIRLQLILSPRPAGALTRMSEASGQSKREIVDRALLQLERSHTE